jgi:hypothetical protein
VTTGAHRVPAGAGPPIHNQDSRIAALHP